MTRTITAAFATLLFAGTAVARDPAADLERALEAREVEISAQLESMTERALRHHKSAAEAPLRLGDCRGAIDSAEARALTASERHRRLVDCFAQQRANAELVAVNPD
jgi:hypothetical protein